RFRTTLNTAPVDSLFFSRLPEQRASLQFFRATLCAELGRADEALREFAQGRAQLKLARGDKPGHDRGRFWYLAYQGEIWQREAQEVFKTKGISLPEPTIK